MRLAYIGRDLFAPSLAGLLEAGHAVEVMTSHGPGSTASARLHRIAQRHGIPVAVGWVGPAEMRGWAARGVEAVLCGGWPRRLPPPADFGMWGLNIHPSLLPEGRGPWPLPRVILEQHPRAGVTLHELVPDFDAGPIVAQAAFAVPPWYELETLVDRCRRLAARLVVEFFADPVPAWAARRPQVGGSWWPRPSRADRTLDWRRPAEALLRQARAFGCEGVIGEVEGRGVWLTGIEAHLDSGAPGALLGRRGDRALIATGSGSLEVVIGPADDEGGRST